jgi:geranylgeranyl diphosphate synthase type II
LKRKRGLAGTARSQVGKRGLAGTARSQGGEQGVAGTARSRDERAAYPVELQEKVDAYLEGLRFAAEPGTARLEEAMRYSLLAGGKRIRPVLALATAEALGRPADEVLPLAAAIEMIHTYSLIHDDLPAMDDDELRRGQPTCHVAFGEDVAILAGDGLFAEALRLALGEQRGEPANVLAAVREVVTAAGTHGMVGGQFLDVAGGDAADLRAGGAREPTISLRRLHELKTGALIAASVGCILALEGLDGPATMPFRRFAAELGVVFQIVDDILDVTGDEAELGKPRGSDERHGKATYVSVFGLPRARDLAKETHASARAALAQAEGDTGRLTQIADYILTRTT